MNKPCTDTGWDNWVQLTYAAPHLNHQHVYGMVNVMRWEKDSSASGATAESITDDEWRLITPPLRTQDV